MGCKLFALVAAMARLCKRNIRKLDKVPRKYAGREVHLDSEIDRDTPFLRIRHLQLPSTSRRMQPTTSSSLKVSADNLV